MNGGCLSALLAYIGCDREPVSFCPKSEEKNRSPTKAFSHPLTLARTNSQNRKLDCLINQPAGPLLYYGIAWAKEIDLYHQPKSKNA